MSVKCPKCKKKHDIRLFEGGRQVICGCGMRLGIEHEEIFHHLEEVSKEYNLSLEEEKLSKIKQFQDKIVVLIMNTDYPEVDIEIEKQKFKDLIRDLFPTKVYLYEMIFEPRFKRLWEQFREAD